jgi:ATP-dependent helicase/nuclease subunit B
MRARGETLLAWAGTLDRPGGAPAPAPRPAPRPPVAARPRRLSATDVERLIRDPYAIYAKRVLRLRRLDPVDAAIDAADRGTLLHAVMARFAEVAADPAADPADALRRAVDETLAASPAPVALRRLWRARFERLAPAFLAGERARRAAGVILATERMGVRDGPLPGFVLSAVADRIDRRADGTLAIYDYKSGEIPSKKQVALFAKQLPLEAAIAAAGGFEGAPAAPVAELAFISLSGGAGGGTTQALEGDPAEAAAEAWEGLARLLAAYDDPATPYLARARPRRIAYASDYDHLSRYGEWEDGA